MGAGGGPRLAKPPVALNAGAVPPRLAACQDRQTHSRLPCLQVILRRPHEFKIRCLEDIRSLFPPDWNPFYAGFGNRDTDEISYLAVGVPPSRIFIINPKGALGLGQASDLGSVVCMPWSKWLHSAFLSFGMIHGTSHSGYPEGRRMAAPAIRASQCTLR